jgi:hypothetical protein
MDVPADARGQDTDVMGPFQNLIDELAWLATPFPTPAIFVGNGIAFYEGVDLLGNLLAFTGGIVYCHSALIGCMALRAGRIMTPLQGGRRTRVRTQRDDLEQIWRAG